MKLDIVAKLMKDIQIESDYIGVWGYVSDVLNKIPSTSMLDSASAELLALESLRALEMCADLQGRVSLESERLSVLAKRQKAEAQLDRSNETAANKQQAYIYKDDLFIEANNKWINASTLLHVIQLKQDVLSRFHYVCRDVAKSSMSVPSGWVGTNERDVQTFSREPVSITTTDDRVKISETNKEFLAVDESAW